METEPTKQGRPSIYTQELAETICNRIASGESVRSISRDETMPNGDTIYQWVLKRNDFSEQYARARNTQAELMFDELLEIADDGTNDWEERRFGGQTVEVVNNEAVQRSKLRVETRKWYLSKVLPKKFGDKLDLTTQGDKLPTPILNVLPHEGDNKDNKPA